MELKILKSFIAVAKYKSFSEAARELHTVQPAISRHISTLEAELGVNLFHRSSRDVVITLAGEQLLKDANTILALTKQAKTQVKRAHNGQVGALNIAYLSSACLSFMAKLVRTYKLEFPQVHVTLFEMTVTEQIEALKSDRIDIAFTRPLPNSIEDEFIHHNVYFDKLVAIVHSNHYLASKEVINLTELKAESFILFNREEAVELFDEVIMMCKRACFSPNIVSQPLHMQTLLTEVAAGLGVAIAPYCVRKQYSEDCHFIRLENVDTQIPLEVQYKKSNNNSIVNNFVNIVLAAKTSIQQSMLHDKN
ncbi:LysR family transcriptional regulator [Colwellia sp. E2M01]|uniref:LysR family transcriptional regulator n=1 Tax=Colwellia sp. E2M01 TaxID=2841561 RepID=UPI001C0A09F6|nr:LysR family transcriptional regulator [Colwellia sp. E2M01]